LLKAVVFAAFLGFAACAAAQAAAPATDLLVGSVRDGTGVPVSGADVRALDGSEATVGAARTDADGTFAIALWAPARRLEVRCRYCRTERLGLAQTSNVVVVVQRYAALESDVPTPADLSALPYGRIVDDLTLIPFVVPSQGGTNVSDRDLGGGNGLVVDSGVPLVDYATGTSALVDFPDRYVRSISVTGPQDAFRYGSYAGGGVFALAPNTDLRSYAALDGGGAPALALQPSLDGVHAAYGESNDDGILARRADLGVATDFAGGVLDASAAGAGELFAQQPGYDAAARSADLLHVGYATASRTYRTFADFSAADVSLFDDVLQQNEYRSSYLSADFRLEHPAPVSVAIGALATWQTGYALGETPLTGRAGDETVYLEAQTGTPRFGASAGLGLSDVSELETLGYDGRTNGTRLALVPSLGGSLPIGPSGLYLRAGYSEALRAPALLESAAQPSPPPDVAPLERDELAQSALGFDAGGRVRAEAIAYREDVQGFDEQRLAGLGGLLVWQVAPLVSVRAWTLRAAPQEFAEAYGSGPPTGTSHQSLWGTYANGDGLRFDAILQRDIHAPASGVVFDGDAYLPLTRDVAVDLGSARTLAVRHFYFGLRSR
jgi:hypothetical protein